MRGAAPLHSLQLTFQAVDLATDFSFVLLELGLALALGSDATTLFAKVRPRPHESRQRILHSGQINLQPSLPRLRPLGEDVQNHLLPVDHKHTGEFLPVSLLRWREFVVEDDHIGLRLLGQGSDLLRFSRAHQITGMRFAMVHKLPGNDRDAKGVDQLRKLIEQARRLRLAGISAIRSHEHSPLDHLWFFFDLKHSARPHWQCAGAWARQRHVFLRSLQRGQISKLRFLNQGNRLTFPPLNGSFLQSRSRSYAIHHRRGGRFED